MLSFKNEYESCKSLVYGQLFFIVALIIGKEIFNLIGYSLQDIGPKIFVLLASALYGLVLYNMIRISTEHRLIKQMVLYAILFIFITTLILENPFYDLEFLKRTGLILVHITLFILEMSVLIFFIQDLLSDKKTLQAKLWASVATYLTIIISWGGFYDLMSLIIPGAMGLTFPLGMENYAECIGYSLGIVSFNDGIMHPIPLITQLSKIQSIWCSMFLIFLISQFKSKVRQEQ